MNTTLDQPAPVQIQIPKGLEALAKRYLSTRRTEISAFQNLREQSDFEQLRRLSHNLKGTGTSYGFPDITRLGGAIESASKSRNLPEIDIHISALAEYVEAALQQLS